MQKIRKTNEPIPRIVRHRRTDGHSNEFIGPLHLKGGGPKISISIENFNTQKKLKTAEDN